MIAFMIAVIIISSLILLFAFFVAPGRAKAEICAPFYGRNIAHRGFFSPDQSVPENSLAAFDIACEKGYGAELDVQLTKDGHVVVFHDDTLSRMCGVDARVDEYTLEELGKLRLKGTDQTIPLFSDVLETVGGRGPLIVELKTGRRNRELCEKTYALLKDYDGEKCIESFDPFIVGWFRRNAKELFRGFLSQPPRDYGNTAKDKLTGFLLGNVLFNFIARPHFIAYKIGRRTFPVRFCLDLGAVPVAWTAHDTGAEADHDVVIFEHYEPEIRFKPSSAGKEGAN